MSSFFTLPTSQRKRKRASGPEISSQKRTSTTASYSRKRRDADEDSIPSDEESESASWRASVSEGGSLDEDDPNDTAAGRRLKLAEQYLDNIRQEVGDEQEIGFDAADVDRELIAARLKEDVAEDKGHLHRYIAQRVDLSKTKPSFFRSDTLATTAIATCPPYVYTTSKDMRLIKWELVDPQIKQAQDSNLNGNSTQNPKPQRRKPRLLRYTAGNKNRRDDSTFQHHASPILCCAASSDGKFVATGGADRKLIIWDAPTLKPLKVFTQHRDAVTSLAFRGKTNQLFSASKDRTVKIWSLNELAYVETLFGHQDEVLDVAAVGGTQERCVSVGARDRTARLWKVVEESQLVFRGGGAPGSAARKRGTAPRREVHGVIADSGAEEIDAEARAPPIFSEGSLDRVAQIDTQLFVTGSDSGALSLFSLHKKKPLHVLPLAHGWDPAPSASDSSADVAVAGSFVEGETERGPQVGEAEATNSQIDGSHANSFNAQPTSRWITALAAIPYTDLFATGSWNGYVRLWRVTGTEEEAEGGKQRRIEAVGILGDSQVEGQANMDGMEETKPLKAIINDLSIFARGTRGEDGVCIVAALGTEPRLGRWKVMKGGGRKGNDAVVWEIPLRS